MSKIISAMNSMINQKNLITDVLVYQNEHFFKFKNKYIWGITRNDKGEYFLYYYPEAKSTRDALNRYGEVFEDVSHEMVTYRSKDYNDKEEFQTFAALYTLMKEKVFNLDTVLDDIIGDDFL